MISDTAARAAALDPQRSFIVQAPAGSGKTELLTQRYLRLLGSVESPEQILAITFTRKAAAEMRSRILLALESAAGEPPESPHKRATWDLARAVRAADARHQWQLLDQPSRLRIQTIDALNSSLARRLPVLAATGSGLEPTDDPGPLYEAAGRRLLERLGDGSDTATQLEVLIAHLGNRIDRLIGLLSDLLAKRDQWLHAVVRARGSEGLRAELEGTLQRVIERHLGLLCAGLGADRRAELLQLLQYSAGNLLEGNGLEPARRALLERCISHTAAPDADSGSLDLWRAVATMLFKKNNKGELYESVTKTHGFPTTNRDMKTRMLDMLHALGGDSALLERLFELNTLPDPRYGEDQWRTLLALLELLPAAVVELQLVFQAHGQADYVEVALRALRALGTAEEPTDLALAFDYRLQHVLVDEFQDTSFSQLDLLERLTGGWSDGDGRTLFCVGDPMQSIYRFRQAEVGLFIGLQQQGLRNIRLEPLRLTSNFRSTPAVVSWVNQVFPNVLAPRNDAEQGAVQYSPSTAALGDEGGGVSVCAIANGGKETEAERVVGIVRDHLEQEADGNIAVLVTARTHVDAIARELTLADIEFQAVEIEHLRDRPVVQDLIALTRALVHLADRTAWLAVLRAPWCGLTLADLHVLAANNDAVIDEAITAALQPGQDDLFSGPVLSADGLVRLARVHAVLTAALEERGRWPLRIWVERTWNALGGPATMTRDADLEDAQVFFQRLEDIETAGDLEDVARLEERLQRLFASTQSAGQSRVEIMTIHAAKGLEFDTVILPGLQRQMRAEERELLRWARIAGEGGGMVLAPVKAEGSDGDPIYRWIELLERQRVLRERARLLYVAVTRAKRNLYLIGTVQASKREGEVLLRDPRKGSMLHMLWHAVAAMFDSVTPEPELAASQVAAAPQKLRRLPSRWTPPELPTQLPPAANALVDIDQRPVFDWATETSRHIGTLLHRELDRLTRQAGDHSSNDDELQTTQLRQRLHMELAELGVPEDRCAVAAERVIAAVQNTLGDQRGRWVLGLDRQISEAQSELALTGLIDGQIEQGVIDRTFVDADGTRWIVDYKTSSHEGGGLEAFLNEEVVRYRSQLERYARLMTLFRPGQPVRMALYFPLLKAWREVTAPGR